ncbi:MAG: SDR family NAD(P)-dependent oxidoreductase, partial [Anaerolineales bacterium]
MTSALTPIPTAFIIGASSGIGEALARRLAAEGYRVALVARRGELLEKLANDLNTKYGLGCARVYPHDVTHYAEAPELFQRMLADFGRVDVIVYNSGILLPVELSEYNFEKDRQMLEVNLLGALAWLNPAAQVFEQMGSGHIVGISSVAGDRGRVRSPA